MVSPRVTFSKEHRLQIIDEEAPSSTALAISAVAFLSTWAIAGETVDDFESYTSTPQLLQAWSPLLTAEPSLALELDMPRSGAGALRLTATASGGPVDVARLQFDSVRNWSACESLTLWVSRDPSAASIGSTLQVVVSSTSGTTIATGPEVEIVGTSWQRYEIDLAGVDASSVGGLSLAVRPTSGVDAVVRVDDIVATTAPTVFDVSDVHRPFLGFGAQLWPGDSSGLQALTVLDFQWVRMNFGPNWDSVTPQPPTTADFQQMLSYVTANFNGDFPSRLTESVSAIQEAQAAGLTVILNQFKIPDSWLTSSDRLRSSNVDEFAYYWAAVLTLLDQNGARPEYVELANEPNGTWNGRLEPSVYNAFVKRARQELDAAGFGNVKIVGPGLSEMRLNDAYFNALDADAIDAIDAWSTHTWDDFANWDARFAVFEAGVNQADPTGSKPIFVTEYATSIDEFDDVRYDNNETGGSNPASEAPGFAIEVVRNSIRLVNSGVGALVYWEAADQPWNSLTWGLRDRNGVYRPTVNALFPFVNSTTGMSTLVNSIDDDRIAALASPFENGMARLVSVEANASNVTSTREIGFEGALIDVILEAWLFSGGTLQPVASVTEIDAVSGTVRYELPPQSVQTLVLAAKEPAPCTRDFNGDSTVDFFDVVRAIELFASANPEIDRVAPAGVTPADLLQAIEAMEFGCPD